MIRGTNHEQDARFSDKTKKMLEKSQWPDKYDIKVDLKKVDYELIKVWIDKRITKLLGQEDDIVSGTVTSHLDQAIEKEEKVNAKLLHVAISAVLQDNTLPFMSDLWDILDEAQRSPRGIPECLVEEKKRNEEVHRRKLEELHQKKYKMNLSKFNLSTRGTKQDYKYTEQSRHPPKESSKHKHRHRRSRSRSHQKKHRSKSNDKRRRHTSRQKERRERRERRRSGSQDKREKRGRREKEESDSSGVVSSSRSSN